MHFDDYSFLWCGFLSPGRIYITILLCWTCWWSSPSLSPSSLFVLSLSVYFFDSFLFFFSFVFPVPWKKKSYADESIMRYVLCVCWPGARDCHSVGRRCAALLNLQPRLFLPSFLPTETCAEMKYKKYKKHAPSCLECFNNFTHQSCFFALYTEGPAILLYNYAFIFCFVYSLVSMGGVYFFIFC